MCETATRQCRDCEEEYPEAELDDGLCETCLGNYGECEQCCERTLTEELHSAHTHRREVEVCGDCLDAFSRCDDCEEYHRELYATTAGGNHICRSCYEDGYFTCDGCDQVLHDGEYGSDGYCLDCGQDAYDEDEDGVLSYGSDYDLDFRGNPKDGIYYGIELEVDTRGDRGSARHRVQRVLGFDFCVCMNDSSIPRSGFEIISAPATVEVHKERWTPFLDDPSGFRSWDAEGCGMHIHVSRKPLSQLTIGKILVFINATENETFIRRIAGRRSDKARIEHKKVADATGH